MKCDCCGREDVFGKMTFKTKIYVVCERCARSIHWAFTITRNEYAKEFAEGNTEKNSHPDSEGKITA